MKNLQGRTKKAYRLKEQAAIDAINSKYTYDQVCYFFETLYLMLHSDKLAQLGQNQIRDNIEFIQVIVKLIDSPHLIYRVKKCQEDRLSQLEPEPSTVKSDPAKITKFADSLSAHLQWISSVVRKNRRITIEILLGDYYNRFPYIPRQASDLTAENRIF